MAVGGCESFRPLVQKYAWDVNIAMAVMQAESGCEPAAANRKDNHKVCMGSFGLMQISCHSGEVYDPEQNIAIAWQKYDSVGANGQKRGWRPWGAYTSGAYKKYLR